MTTAQKIKYGVMIVGGIAAMALIFTLFKKVQSVKDNSIEIVKAKDETIQAIIRERDTYREWKDAAIAELQRKDSALQVKYQSTIIKYEKIPVYINSLNKDGLRSEYTNY